MFKQDLFLLSYPYLSKVFTNWASFWGSSEKFPSAVFSVVHNHFIDNDTGLSLAPEKNLSLDKKLFLSHDDGVLTFGQIPEVADVDKLLPSDWNKIEPSRSLLEKIPFYDLYAIPHKNGSNLFFPSFNNTVATIMLQGSLLGQLKDKYVLPSDLSKVRLYSYYHQESYVLGDLEEFICVDLEDRLKNNNIFSANEFYSVSLKLTSGLVEVGDKFVFHAKVLKVGDENINATAYIACRRLDSSSLVLDKDMSSVYKDLQEKLYSNNKKSE